MKAGSVIAITGPAAAGKSTLARALQAELSRGGDLWLLLELDVFGRAAPRHWVSMEGRQGRYSERGFTYARTDDGAIALTLGTDGRRILQAFHRSVAAVAKSGVGVICETIVYDDDDWRDWSAALDGVAAYWISVSAPLSVLQAREKADPSRLLQGLAQGMMARRAVGKFDLEVDTSAEDAISIARRVANRQS